MCPSLAAAPAQTQMDRLSQCLCPGVKSIPQVVSDPCSAQAMANHKPNNQWWPDHVLDTSNKSEKVNNVRIMYNFNLSLFVIFLQ